MENILNIRKNKARWIFYFCKNIKNKGMMFFLTKTNQLQRVVSKLKVKLM